MMKFKRYICKVDKITITLNQTEYHLVISFYHQALTEQEKLKKIHITMAIILHLLVKKINILSHLL